ncbi:Eco57I restriction-modification methylase domain-containing protein [Streptomyces phaeochromogenes]|uniref:Eco57I restriction-modification methylase domain-containing protein n=1 Tax=Streptomyces phaeochromogenes TaxID=1923 RepID=UPI0027D7EFB0|nr:Eco57I restriction-modification methylase domain-containing protein [Streptomyces phaeochromogenes]
MTPETLFSLPGSTLPVPASLQEAVEHGEVFTRRWVVDSILDLVGYTADQDLAAKRLVEPACGAGAFLSAIVERLSASCRAHGRGLLDAIEAIEAFDLVEANVERSREAVADVLRAQGWGAAEVGKVVAAWVVQGDFLFQDAHGETADFVVGNPPYIRLEDVPDERMDAYRRVCSSMGGRADIYVGFFELGMRRLKPEGRLGFICADRWMRNQYGRGLRKLVTQRYSMDLVVTMHDVNAFEERVSAYPAITIIRNGRQGVAVAADTTGAFGAEQAQELTTWAAQSDKVLIKTPAFHAARLPHWFPGEDSWPQASPERLAMLEDLSDRFRLLEDEATGTRVGIGIATGADKVFLTEDSTVVEEDRLLPMAMVRDTTSGALSWGGTYLVSPWSRAGQLVDLDGFPLLAAYFEKHRAALSKRYVATKQPDRWYKTIDKVDATLTSRPKLFFPDMKLTIHPVLDEGGHYPHHNLYFIVSDVWDLRVLGGLLLSKVAEAFVEAYAVKMRGGTLRFQAQYLRKIRVPDPEGIPAGVRSALAAAFEKRDVQAATEAALAAYGLDELPD